MMSMPFSPPFNAASRVPRLKRLFGRSPPCQRKQELSKMGLMSVTKSMVRAAGGGSFETSMSAASEAEVKHQAPNTKLQQNLKHQTPTIPFRMDGRCCVSAHNGCATCSMRRPFSRALVGVGIWKLKV